MKRVRNAARALILRDGRLLAVKMRDRDGCFYVLPGGGQEHGETLIEALKRECREEIDCGIAIGPLVYIREYIGKNHTFAARHNHFHQVETVFRCELVGKTTPCNGAGMDNRQIDVEWLDLDKLDDLPFYPVAVKTVIREQAMQDATTQPNIYLGDIN